MHSITQLIALALKEDIGPGDVTTDNLIDPDLEGKGVITAKEPAVLAGLHVAQQVFESLDPEVRFILRRQDGDRLHSGDPVLEVSGKMRTLLKGERTALNFLQHLSGIATCVKSYVDLLRNRPVRLVDTRKTTPGLRSLEKYAVRMGGAANHRMGLYDGILIKDNHIAACGSIPEAIRHVRRKSSHLLKIEIEVSDLAGVKEALAAAADVIMLDNMTLSRIKEAVAMIDGKALVEVSGGITRDNMIPLADTGVDIISVGALIHSARSVDMSMTIEADKSRNNGMLE